MSYFFLNFIIRTLWGHTQDTRITRWECRMKNWLLYLYTLWEISFFMCDRPNTNYKIYFGMRIKAYIRLKYNYSILLCILFRTESYVYFRKCLPHVSLHVLQVLTTCIVEKRCCVHVISHIRVHATYLKSSRRRLDPIWLDFKIILVSSRKKWKDKEACSDEMLFQTNF